MCNTIILTSSTLNLVHFVSIFYIKCRIPHLYFAVAYFYLPSIIYQKLCIVYLLIG